MTTQETIITSQRFAATYLIETPADVGSVAEEMAGEQSTSTSRRVAGETDEIIVRHGARVERVERLETRATPSMVSAGLVGNVFHRARVTISWPIHNIGASLPMLWTTLLGNQTGMKRLTGIRLERASLPSSFIDVFPRPAFGIDGTRSLASVHGRPIIGSVIKPNVGLVSEETAMVVADLCEAGVDFIKDDELHADPPYSPVARRVEAVMPIIWAYAERTGQCPMYAFNITGDADDMRRNHDLVLAAGGTCVMVNLNSVGLSGLIALRRHSQLPIHGHRAGWASMTRFPLQGLDFEPYQMIMRLAGVDQLHVSGLGGKFWETPDSVMRSARACLTPLDPYGAVDDRAMPVFSGGSTVWSVEPTYSGIGSIDIIFVCGGAIFAHPDGMRAGQASIRAAWDAAIQQINVVDAGNQHPELATALKYWDN